MPNVVICSHFLTAFTEIPQKQLNKSAGFVTRFQNNPTLASINYEPSYNVQEKRAHTRHIRLDYRGVVLQPKEDYTYHLI